MFIAIVQPPESQSVCVGGTATFTCVVMWPDGSDPIGGATWFIDNGDASVEPGHTVANDVNGRSAPANVTTTLMVTNVNITDNNGSEYRCAQGLVETSDPVLLTVFG